MTRFQKRLVLAVWAAAVALVGALVLAWQLVSDRHYPRAARESFLVSCREAGGDDARCRCVVGQLEKRVPLAEFQRIDTELADRLTLPPREQRDLLAAVARCR